MSTETRPRILKGIFEVLKGFGNTETIEYDSEVAIVDPMLIEALENIEKGKLKKEAEQAANVTGGSKKAKGGFVKKMDTNPEIGQAMRVKRDQVVKEAKDKGIEL